MDSDVWVLMVDPAFKGILQNKLQIFHNDYACNMLRIFTTGRVEAYKSNIYSSTRRTDGDGAIHIVMPERITVYSFSGEEEAQKAFKSAKKLIEIESNLMNSNKIGVFNVDKF